MFRSWVTGALAAFLLAEGALVAFWLSGAGAVRAARRVPTAEEQPSAGSSSPSARLNAGTLIRGKALPDAPFSLSGEWPQFRGPARTNVAPAEELIPGRLPGHLPQQRQAEYAQHDQAV